MRHNNCHPILAGASDCFEPGLDVEVQRHDTARFQFLIERRPLRGIGAVRIAGPADPDAVEAVDAALALRKNELKDESKTGIRPICEKKCNGSLNLCFIYDLQTRLNVTRR